MTSVFTGNWRLLARPFFVCGPIFELLGLFLHPDLLNLLKQQTQPAKTVDFKLSGMICVQLLSCDDRRQMAFFSVLSISL